MITDIRRALWTMAAPPALAATAVLSFDPAPPVAALLIIGAGALGASATVQWIVRPLGAAVETSRLRHAQAEVELMAERADRELRVRLERALRNAESEPAALRIGMRAVSEAVPEGEISLLLNVPDEPRIGWQVALVDGELQDAVPMNGSPSCSALSEGSPVLASSSSLDACAHLGDLGVEVSAACVPLRANERTMGAVCITTAPGEPLDDRTLDRVEWIVDRIGVRAAEQQLLDSARPTGGSDPLTGLPAATALRPHLRDMVRSLSPFCLAVVEIDRFDDIDSDAAADASVVSVAQVLCDTVRPDDMICRVDSGGFAVVLEQASSDQAVAIMERVRERLALSLTEAALVEASLVELEESRPGITCSMGVVESHRATSLDEIVDLATTACDAASAAGGNRVSVADRSASQN